MPGQYRLPLYKADRALPTDLPYTCDFDTDDEDNGLWSEEALARPQMGWRVDDEDEVPGLVGQHTRFP